MRHDDRDDGWQLTQAHRLSGVIGWDPETEGALPLLIVDGRTFTWDQIGRMLMAFEGFTLNAIVEDTIEVVGGPLADGRLGIQASSCLSPGRRAPSGSRRTTAGLDGDRRVSDPDRTKRSWPNRPGARSGAR